MNQLDNIERRDTSGHDKTAGSSYQEQRDLADALIRQRRAYDVCDIAEELNALCVELAKDGRALELGAILIAKMGDTILRRALRESQP